jgi:hypothetical protein
MDSAKSSRLSFLPFKSKPISISHHLYVQYSLTPETLLNRVPPIFVPHSAHTDIAVPMSNHPTTSPDTSKEIFRLHPSSSSPIDGDPDDNRGVHRSVSDPDPRTSCRTSVQSMPGSMTDGGHTTSIAGSIGTQNRRASSMTLVQRTGTTMSKLFKPERKVGKPPGFMRELRTILFGSCALHSPAFLSEYRVLMQSNRA